MLSPIRSKRPSSRSACSRTDSGIPASSIFVRYSSTTEPSVLAELLADRLELLAQDVLTLLLLDTFVDVLADPRAHLEQRQPLALQPQGELEALGHVHGLEQAPHFCAKVRSGE